MKPIKETRGSSFDPHNTNKGSFNPQTKQQPGMTQGAPFNPHQGTNPTKQHGQTTGGYINPQQKTGQGQHGTGTPNTTQQNWNQKGKGKDRRDK